MKNEVLYSVQTPMHCAMFHAHRATNRATMLLHRAMIFLVQPPISTPKIVP